MQWLLVVLLFVGWVIWNKPLKPQWNRSKSRLSQPKQSALTFVINWGKFQIKISSEFIHWPLKTLWRATCGPRAAIYPPLAYVRGDGIFECYHFGQNGSGVFGSKRLFLASTSCVKIFRSKFKAMSFRGLHWLQKISVVCRCVQHLTSIDMTLY